MGKDLQGGVEIIQKASYYPFGLIMKKSDYGLPSYPQNRYLYNGKEINPEKMTSESLNWLDYGARMYDPQLGRFHTQDRFAEKFSHVSSYVYAMNNPISIIDGDGMQPWPITDTWNGYSRKVISNYGMRTHPVYNTQTMHTGMDMHYASGNADLGAPTYATHDGKIVKIVSTDKGGYGKYVVVQSADGSIQTLYAHLDKVSSGLEVGYTVTKGQQIGEMGTTGPSTGVHLHYELRQKGADGFYSPINPMLDNGKMIDPQAMLDNSSDYHIAVAKDKIAGIDKKIAKAKIEVSFKAGKISQTKYENKMNIQSINKNLQQKVISLWEMKKKSEKEEQ